MIFVYYVLIRLGEQAGDTGMMTPFLSMWAANLVLGAIALALLWLNHREAAFDPLDPAHYLRFVPKVRRQRAARPAPPARRAAPACRGAAGRGRPHPAAHPALPLAPRPLHRPLLGRATCRSSSLAFVSIYVLGRVHGPDRRHPAAQASRGRIVLHYYAFHLWQIGFTVAPVAVLVGRPGHPRPPGPPQRDHRHEGGRDQRLPRGGARARDGHPGEPPPLRHAGVDAARSPTRPPPSTAT